MEVATEMSSSIYESKSAKKVYLYRNGAVNSDPKCLIVNQRQVRDFGTFLSRVTSGLKAPVAIRNIYTPAGGHKVKNLDSLESGRYYVAGGSEQFKKIKYGNSSPQRLLSRRPTRKEFTIPSRVHQAVVASARYKKPIEKPFVIHVFRNGDFRYRGARVLLPRRIMGSWEHVLEIVTEKADLFTPAKRLCTLDGNIVYAVSELQDGGKYVAIEGTKSFQKVAYCATDDSKALMHTFPKAAIRLHRIPRKRPPHQGHHDVPSDGAVSDPGKTPIPPPARKQRPDKRKSRPMAGRKNKEAREKAIEDHRADSIFGGSPTRELDTSVEGPLGKSVKDESTAPQHPLSKRETVPVTKDAGTNMSTSTLVEKTAVPDVYHAPTTSTKQEEEKKAEYVEETQGETVFKAKSQRADLADAEVVAESKDTEVERPLDQEEAEEVEEEKEEEFEGEGEAALGNKVSQSLGLQPQAQPLHTSIELSVDKAQPTSSSHPGSATTGQQTDPTDEQISQPTPSPPPQASEGDTKQPSTGSAASSSSSTRSRHSKTSNGDGSSPTGDAKTSESDREKEGERNADDKSDGEVSNPPEEVIEEEDSPATNEKDESTVNTDTVEEVPEEIPAEHDSSQPPAQPEQVEDTTAATTNNGEEAVPSEPADTSVQEEIVEEVDTSVQDDTGSSQKDDEPTTAFLVEDPQEQQ